MRRALLVGGFGGALCCMDCSLIDAALPSMIGHVFSSGWQAAFFVAIAPVGMIVASAVGKPALTRQGSSGVLRTAAALSVLGTGILVLSAGCYPILVVGLDANLADVIIKGAYALMTAVAMVLIGHASSRKLLMIGSVCVSLSLVSAALSF